MFFATSLTQQTATLQNICKLYSGNDKLKVKLIKLFLKPYMYYNRKLIYVNLYCSLYLHCYKCSKTLDLWFMGTGFFFFLSISNLFVEIFTWFEDTNSKLFNRTITILLVLLQLTNLTFLRLRVEHK